MFYVAKYIFETTFRSQNSMSELSDQLATTHIQLGLYSKCKVHYMYHKLYNNNHGDLK